VLLQNKLKEDTIATVKALTVAEIDMRMITGDNLMTAVNVSYRCGMVKPSCNITLLDLENDQFKITPYNQDKVDSFNISFQIEDYDELNTSNRHFGKKSV